jgi:peptidoglycan hydrolase-like protein with peptidoglycan-binding domain
VVLRKTNVPVADNCVKSLQRSLNQWLDENDGFQLGPLLVDGVFGPITQERVVAFQRHFGLKVDGVVGTRTWAELEPYL